MSKRLRPVTAEFEIRSYGGDQVAHTDEMLQTLQALGAKDAESVGAV